VVQGANLQFRGETLAFVRRAIIRIVLADLLRDQSGAMALQHLGILWIIYEYSDAQDPITTARLKELTKTTSTAIIKYTERLENLGLIKRKRVTASHGKGRAWEYHPTLPDDLLSKAFRGILEAGTLPLSFEAFTGSELPPSTPDEQSVSNIQPKPHRESTRKAAPQAQRDPRGKNSI
jgi:DNA-binding MarR family transcriptional regulator